MAGTFFPVCFPLRTGLVSPYSVVTGKYNQEAAAQSELALSCLGFSSFPLPGTQGQATAEDAAV